MSVSRDQINSAMARFLERGVQSVDTKELWVNLFWAVIYGLQKILWN